jgi:hypothetical protein
MTALSSVAVAAAARFEGRHLTIRRSRAVHDVAQSPWIAGLQLPTPACRVGVGGWSIDDLHPTSSDVTCLRCLRHGSYRATSTVHTVGEQLALDVA